MDVEYYHAEYEIFSTNKQWNILFIKSIISNTDINNKQNNV